MRYDHLSLLPEEAFKPLGKRMTLEGKSSKTPKAPDYTKLAQQEAANQLAINRSTTMANRVDQFTPFGSLTYQQGTGAPTFDQSGYDAAMSRYGSAMDEYNSASRPRLANPWMDLNPYDIANQNNRSYGQNNRGNAPVAPDRSQFYSVGNPDKWSSTMTLDPEIQKVLDQTVSGQQQGYDALQSYLSNIQDSSRIPGAVINPGQTAQQAIMARLNPQFQTQEEDVRTRLYNQGVRPGTEAWDNEYRNFSQAKNDAYSQAALQGINLDIQARDRALQEQSLPMNAINAYLGGTNVMTPQFTDYAQQANAQAPDLMGAAQGQYGAQMNSANAKNAAAANTQSGLFSLAGGALMFF